MQKKSGFTLAALALFAFALVSSPAAPPSASAALQSAPEVQAPVPSPLQSPAAPAVTPANGDNTPEWLATKTGVGKPLCRCSKDSQCGTGGACCWWPNQTCGICC